MLRRAIDCAQTPSGAEVFLDHVGWFVPDMKAASRKMKRLGFVLTPFVAQHNANPEGGPAVPAGTGNSCAMLQRGYLEILSSMEGVSTQLSQQLDAAVARYTGVHLIAFSVADVKSTHAQLNSSGFKPLPPVHLRRPLELNDGTETEVEFTVLRVPPGTMEEGRIQMLRQETPDLVWQDHLIARENGIAALAGILLCVDDPAATAERFSRFIDRSSVGGEAYRVIDLDRGRLGFASLNACQEMLSGIQVPTTPFMAAVALQSGDPSVARTLCEDGEIVLLPDGGDDMVRIHPDEAAGAAIVIFGPDSQWPPDA